LPAAPTGRANRVETSSLDTSRAALHTPPVKATRGAALVLAVLLLGAVAIAGSAQGTRIVSADEYFTTLRTHYTGITSYEATITIKQDTSTSSGRLSYKAPGFLNVRFDSGMIINMDGKKIDVTMPSQHVWMEQVYKTQPDDQAAGLATAAALSAMKGQYSVAYLTGPGTVVLDKDTPEQVVKLKLVARASTSFSQIILSVTRDLVIRRAEATLTNGSQMQVDFTGMKPNVTIPASRFVFTPPDGYEQVRNWLFDPSAAAQ
jgi:outer membrane lipoprotein-sorting protein